VVYLLSLASENIGAKTLNPTLNASFDADHISTREDEPVAPFAYNVRYKIPRAGKFPKGRTA
jgi:hypothetical protein